MSFGEREPPGIWKKTGRPVGPIFIRRPGAIITAIDPAAVERMNCRLVSILPPQPRVERASGPTVTTAVS
jgi:hypothetical protein